MHANRCLQIETDKVEMKKGRQNKFKKKKKKSNHRLSDNSRHTQHFAEPYKQAFKFWPWILVTCFSHIITHQTLGILCIILNHTLKSECNPFPTISTWPVIYLCLCACIMRAHIWLCTRMCLYFFHSFCRVSQEARIHEFL